MWRYEASACRLINGWLAGYYHFVKESKVAHDGLAFMYCFWYAAIIWHKMTTITLHLLVSSTLKYAICIPIKKKKQNEALERWNNSATTKRYCQRFCCRSSAADDIKWMQFNRPYTPVVVKAYVLVVIWPTHSTFVSINKFHRTLLYGPERKTNFVTAFYLLIVIYWRSSKMHENEYEMLAIHFSLAKWHTIQKWVSCETNGKQWLIMRSIFLSVVAQKPFQCRIGSCCWRGRCCDRKP